MGVTLLMAVYNGAEFFEESLTSILNQTYTDWELLIGINGHKKYSDTEELIKKTIKDIVPTSQRNQIKVTWTPTPGKSKVLNKMVSLAKYSKIGVIDVDDLFMPDKLERQMPLTFSYDVVGTQCYYMYDSDKSVFMPDIPYGLVTRFVPNPIINSSVVMSKELAHWDTKIENGTEDYDLWLSLNSFGKSFYNLQEPLIYHRIHQKSHFNTGRNSDVSGLLKRYAIS
jgi:glycosyltransferase involved in cell wall biosynthesis